MHYSIRGKWLNLMIDDDFSYHTPNAFLDSCYISTKKRRTLIQEQAIYLDYQPVLDLDMPLEKGHQLRLNIFKQEKPDYVPQNLFDLKVYYEDAFCLIAYKPEGYIVYGEDKAATGTMANVISYYYQTRKVYSAVRHIHRLDKQTRGLLFYCKCAFFQPYFDAMLKNKKISRKYLAVVEGSFPWQTYDCTLAIGKDRHHNNRFIVSINGKKAITHFTKLADDGKTSQILCELETGRTHQIRVHLSSLGFPIINDEIYGHVSQPGPMELTAFELSWLHPLTKEVMTCSLFNQKIKI